MGAREGQWHVSSYNRTPAYFYLWLQSHLLSISAIAPKVNPDSVTHMPGIPIPHPFHHSILLGRGSHHLSPKHSPIPPLVFTFSLTFSRLIRILD